MPADESLASPPPGPAELSAALRRVVIVGAGQAGARAALAIRECNQDVSIMLLGSEKHAPYERPDLSKSLLIDPDHPTPYVLDANALAAQGINFRPRSPIISIDREARTVCAADGSRIFYDRLLLATGSKPRRISINGLADDDICYLRTLDDCRALEQRLRSRPSLAVLGGGFIGLEVAASAARRGCTVTVIEAGERLLPRLGCSHASAIVAAHHRKHGIDIRTGCRVVSSRGGNLMLSDETVVSADVIVAGIGIEPDTQLAEAAGLAVDDGILVDEYGRTSDPYIYAAGDVTQQEHPVLSRRVRLESWHNANEQARSAGRSLAGYPTRTTAVPWIWSDQGDLNIQSAGSSDGANRTIVREDPDELASVTIFHLADDRVIGGVTVNRGGDMALIRRLIEQGDLALPAKDLRNPEIPLRKFAAGRRTAASRTSAVESIVNEH